MYLLQGTWERSGRLLLWAERRDDRSAAAAAEATHEPQGRAHPACLPDDEVVGILEQLDVEGAVPVLATLELPQSNGRPLVSPSLRNDADPQDLSWGRFSVPAVALPPLDAIAFLTSVPPQLPRGGRTDGSVLFWRETTKLLLELLARGAFIPTLARGADGWNARWLPLSSSSADQARISVLVRSMPGICRSVVDWAADAPPEPEPLIRSFIELGTDALIRSFMSRTPLVPDVDARRLSIRAAPAIAWLRALTEGNGTIGSEPDMRQLEQHLASWAGSLLRERASVTLKAYFIIEPPDPRLSTPSTEWRVGFGVDVIGRKRLRLDALQIFRRETRPDDGLTISHEAIEEFFLRELGRAAPSFPALADALDRPFPLEARLNTEEAYRFLREIGPRLEELEFTVELPAWWRDAESSLGLRLEVDTKDEAPGVRPGFGLLASTELLHFSWSVAVGEETLSLEEFYDLAKSRAPLVPVRGRWLELNPKRIEATFAFLEAQNSRRSMRFVDVLRLGLGVDAPEGGLPVVSFSARGWLGRLLSSDTHDVELVKEPGGFHGTLRPYQREGLSWLHFHGSLGIGACLADDMGLGKTVQLLALLVLERERRQPLSDRPTLLIVPMSIVANWEREAERFAPSLRVYVHHGAQRLSGEAFRNQIENADLVITTYSLAFRDEGLLSSVSWGRIALDEAQNIKNLETKQTRSVRRLAQRQSAKEPGCSRVALTGTPLENHLEELWSIFDFLNPGFLGSVQEFRERFAVPIERYRDRDASTRLSRVLQPFILRRLKNDPRIAHDLPEKLEMDVVLSLTKEQAVLYQSVLDDMLPQVSSSAGMHRKGLVLATITKLKQICDHPALFLRDGDPLDGRSHKVTHLEQLLETLLAEGDKTLVFTQFVQMGQLLKPYLERRFGVDVLFLHGGLTRKAREALVQQFQQRSGPPIFILSLRAGGFGLNLTEANQVIHLDQWWNPAVEEQATDRVHRIGQERRVQVRRLICKGTLEERISELLQRKRDLVEQVVRSTKNFVTQMSNEELRDLLKLSAG